MLPSHEAYMNLALKEAEKAFIRDEVPVGAIVVMQNQIIGKGFNQTEMLTDVTAHAEMIAITAAFNYLGSKYLSDATLYVTIEPCLMCAGALFWSKISHIYIGASDEKNGYRKHCSHSPFHPKTTIETGLLEGECAWLMKEFFKRKRK